MPKNSMAAILDFIYVGKIKSTILRDSIKIKIPFSDSSSPDDSCDDDVFQQLTLISV